ncbi:TPA: YraN family protein [Candidatus Beckwithbacteria bacterium]|nr:MAG: hypothetical protein UY43_C0001G0219 [Candidatus Beckwithbacteria bacterium GW2011_GWC1_49_16]OGD48607.1 MAG: YraN family protein [Candidatus Beckwithbacteria bacterium RIFCSPHIGHO2_01_FULL_49_39]OGD50433.1 MAG: YraN family protein [Candidatus Beckwithbacteria bacterium RIFCSPHIGHO2_12_FULL_49_13]OGD52010.1 MAG: YraN family protein [Candidatus Beckwithbacteria bacterium RIFCSPHIGHO2_02_FULL_49_13]OGD58759.1 MAG: YraN family protein [Candidatus Beckwithbacteria bacterium RIFCSPLOWO2_02_F
MRQHNVARGKQGENLAVKFLQEKGYRILERNFRTRFGEVDIVAKDGQALVFVEVKTKSSDSFGEPWEMVDERKLEQVKKMAQVYLQSKNYNQQSMRLRIDVVGVWLDSGKLKHWQAVY